MFDVKLDFILGDIVTLGTFPGIGLSHHDALYPDQGPLIRQLRPRNFRGKETIVPKCSVVGIIPRDRVNSIDCCTLYNGHQRSWKGRSALISLFIAVLQAMYKIQTWYRRSFCMVVISLFFYLLIYQVWYRACFSWSGNFLSI